MSVTDIQGAESLRPNGSGPKAKAAGGVAAKDTAARARRLVQERRAARRGERPRAGGCGRQEDD